MSLQPGARLGPYEIAGPLGAGGMGEVYRAKDTRLGREVALKIMPAHLSQNPEVRERFEREAKLISSLNHPNICTLYDIGREGDADYFVMELLDGESLGARLERGPMKPDETLRIAAQIADGLAAAHKQGIVHRDLKPGNVVLTKAGAKILDFGVAKLHDEQVVEMATRTTPLTTAGSMVGTVQYMSPEQLEGHPVDHRADLFSFGALLYEMLTGRRAFEGQSQASVIAAILTIEPRAVSELAPASPAALDRVVKLCLAKDPDERWQSAGDLARELRWIADGKTDSRPSAVAAAPIGAKRGMQGRELIAWGVAGILLAAAILLLVRPAPGAPQRSLRRFTVASPEGAAIVTDGVVTRISPDGRNLVFGASNEKGVASLWVRPLDSLDARPLPGTEDGALPFWSPDGRTIGYFSGAKLKKASIGGGAPETICESGDGRGGTWAANGTIVFAPEAAGPLYRVSQGGGAIQAVTSLDPARKETGHRWPFFLPDGKHFLYVTLPADKGNYDVFVGSTDSMDRKFLFKAAGAPIYASPGYLIYPREGTLVAHRFDVSRRELSGDPISLGSAPAPSQWSGAQVMSASRDGVLARPAGGFPNTNLLLYDRAGKFIQELPVPSGHYEQPTFSPDGKKIAVLRCSSPTAKDVWLIDLDHPVPSRFTFAGVDLVNFAWSADGGRIVYGVNRSGPQDIYVKEADGAAEEIPLVTGGAIFNIPTSFSADGRTVVFEKPDPKTSWDLYVVPADGRGAPSPFLVEPGLQRVGVVSPDGRWIAYASDESGRTETYVQSFPVAGSKAQVSTGGDSAGLRRWTAGGRELMTLGGDGLTVLAVDVTTGARFRAGAQHALFKVRPDNWGLDFSPDGQRVLVAAPPGDPKPPSIAIDLDWTAELER